MKNGSQEIILLKKEFDSDFSKFWPHFHIYMSHHWQNCNYSKANKAIGLKSPGNVYN